MKFSCLSSTRFTPIRVSLLVALAFVLLLIPGALVRAQELQEIRGRTMGTTYSLKYFACGEVDEAALQQAIDVRLAQIDERMSTYRDDSELSRFNSQAKPDEWFAVSTETATVAALALKIAAETGGAFDPTVGPLVDLWRFGPRSGSADFAPPTSDEINAARERVGYQKLEVRLEPPALKTAVAGLRLDLSAIAKGHGVDALLDTLLTFAVGSAMVEIGGEVRTFGPRGAEQPWRIGVEAPTPGQRSLQTIVPVVDQALATSGDYRNYYEHNGKRYSHTIDPRTGRPVEHSLGSATILSKQCARADALATAILVLGPDEGLAWANENNVAALLLVRGADAIEVEASQEFQRIGTLPLVESTPSTVKPVDRAGFLTIFLIAIVVFGVALFGMAIGVVLSNRSIQGSCGGLAGMKDDDGKTLCVACSDPSPECAGENAKQTTSG